ncbi:hypothetical protein BDP55DRAFT_754597 [Colletotrichum godetiae]|uniref:Uncharacterized protein n=1 Tax=Colletotrichum godetiae TaxID=1209918 RepID=A0AAJ0AFQ8_9PEZI|nr:uncharacterized protein BDP55DRAFT_754597 [Colletotrichum godetiae]KAK1660085.1 hypothetical protein BDP55DRAFT_754597 [Colletotrichum godetiae]
MMPILPYCSSRVRTHCWRLRAGERARKEMGKGLGGTEWSVNLRNIEGDDGIRTDRAIWSLPLLFHRPLMSGQAITWQVGRQAGSVRNRGIGKSYHESSRISAAENHMSSDICQGWPCKDTLQVNTGDAAAYIGPYYGGEEKKPIPTENSNAAVTLIVADTAVGTDFWYDYLACRRAIGVSRPPFRSPDPLLSRGSFTRDRTCAGRSVPGVGPANLVKQCSRFASRACCPRPWFSAAFSVEQIRQKPGCGIPLVEDKDFGSTWLPPHCNISPQIIFGCLAESNSSDVVIRGTSNHPRER